MMPRLGRRYDIDCKVTAKPKDEYLTDDYFALDLPVAPAVMVGEEILVEGTDVSEYDLEACICRHLGRPEPEKKKKGLLDRFR